MDTSNLIFGAVVTAVCLIPFAMMRLSMKKRERILMEPFNKMVDSVNCKISTIDVEKDFIIGADKDKKHVFFYKSLPGCMEEHTIDLNAVKRCEIINIGRTVNQNNDVYKVIDKLALRLTPKQSESNAIDIELYDSGRSFQIGEELEIAQKWHEKINTLLMN